MKIGLIVLDENNMTNIEGVFAGGDVCTGRGRTVCKAIDSGKKAAAEIDKYLKTKSN